MEFKFFCPLWGSSELDFPVFLEKVKSAGYDGVEMAMPLDNKKTKHRAAQIREFGLELIGQHYETNDADPDQYKNSYRMRLENLIEAEPLLINSQSSRDFFSFDDTKSILEVAFQLEKISGIKIVHETHRGKFSFAAHITKKYIEALPNLRLGLDLSHWCNVAESYLEDQPEAIELALSRTDHIHARIGYPEGPQIPDPRLPEWQEAVEHHLNWWEKVTNFHRQNNSNLLTITSEFGPYPYMWHIPYTNQPITSQWDVNVYMMQLLKKRLKT